MLEITSDKYKKIIFFISMWTFFSLNSRYFALPHANLLRWVSVFLLIMAVAYENGGRISRPPVLILFFSIAVIPSLYSSIARFESLSKILSFVIIIWGVYIYFNSIDNIDEYDSAMNVIILVILVFEIQNILCMVLGMGYGSGGDRATGNTTNANTLGVYSNLAMIASYYTVQKSNGIKKIAGYVLLVSAIILVVLSGSRGAAGTLVVNILILYFLKQKNYIVRLISSILGVGIIYLLFSGKIVISNFDGLNRLLQENGANRGDFWERAIDTWERFPIFGCGYNISKYYNYATEVNGYMAFHNSYLSYLSETGIWGCVVLGSYVIKKFINFTMKTLYEWQSGQFTVYSAATIMLVNIAIAAYAESFLFAVGSTEGCLFWVLFMWLTGYIMQADYTGDVNDKY